MNRLFSSIFLCIAAIASIAQQKADIMVGYDFSFRNWESDSLLHSRRTLLASPTAAKYFNDISLWNDSLSSTPGGKEQLNQIIMAACITQTPDGGITFDSRKGPVKKVHNYIFSDLSAENIRFYDKFGDTQGFYDEPWGEIQWQLTDSTATVLGYECIAAQADYHGRHWTAWFAPELPIPFGPWKLHGLPGLILKARSDNDIEFTATGLEQTDRIMSPMYSPDNYGKMERKKALEEEEYFFNNREAIIKASFGGSVQFNYNTADRPKYDPAKYAAEPDYRQ